MNEVLLPISGGQVDQSVNKVLALAVGDSSPQRIAGIIETYETKTNHCLYRCLADGALGIIGLEILSSDDARIRHIGVEPAAQKRGIGRMMINASVEELGYRTLRAETDADAVGFYSSSGFLIDSLGEKYPGVERFECTLLSDQI